jgi:Domain of unknown function (DUF4965)/Domain of unknown function (DUF1793)/Domain of unknown function (DUF5127)/Domain of unknown function (DUF4964)
VLKTAYSSPRRTASKLEFHAQTFIGEETKMQLKRLLRAFAMTIWGASLVRAQQFRPPAVPLIANDPYFSVWSMADRLTDDVTKHWTGTPQSLCGLARIDGTVYRIIGNEPEQVAAMEQRKVEVMPTRTIYRFEGAGVGITLIFMTPVLPNDVEVMARPVTYVTWRVQSLDGAEHAVSLYFDASAELAVDTPAQQVVASRYQFGGRTALRVGSEQQPILQKAGDSIRIDWGYLYALPSPGSGADEVITTRRRAREKFAETGALEGPDPDSPQSAGGWDGPALSFRFDLGKVGSASVTRYVVLAYDELFSMQYLNRWLRPYWKRKGASVADLLDESVKDYESLSTKCKEFDEELMADLTRTDGEDYARMASLVYRESFAAQVLAADYDGTLLSFPKENSSCGCVSTVDVIYPAAPILLLFNTALLKGSMTPVMEYARTYHWPFRWAPHDLGIYPHANGHDYPADVDLNSVEGHMPVEESANMILMALALATADGNADYAAQYWPLFSTWAKYLKDKGLDPERQIVTDDFTGPLAHNANLSVKAISALAAYAQLCDLLGRHDEAVTYRKTAEEYARKWEGLAKDGDHYKLAFDQPGTWSQKYNLVWDKVLRLNVFPKDVARKELAFYQTRQDVYGLPLDSRAKYTKLDWLLWTATLADNRKDFDAFFLLAYKFMNETPDRVPLTDFYDTDTGKHRYFQARSVVGGVFMPMLAEPATWKKWASRAARGQSHGAQ